MNYTERHIVETYAGLFSSLSSVSKLELIESLTKSIKNENENKETKFFKSFGAFASDKSAEEIFSEIKTNRKFKSKEISL